ncbi:hypothetical protein CTAYLR_004633 [Chrysophaeum taylorii]|uniref:Glycosyltransferase n=1 Tax=Chrysophaeum taylorii TaxID=2483200 RepID=A0AAD7UR56_9STRA|nr:hypothetical protein CTAYLR_004633 [Chrysophaeum taylorii]
MLVALLLFKLVVVVVVRVAAVCPRGAPPVRGVFPRQVFYTGTFEPGLWNRTQWPRDYTFHFYNNSDLDASTRELSRDIEGLWEAYSALRPWAFKADLWRYAILYSCGGIYVDSKMVLTMDFDAFLDIVEPLRKDEKLLVTCIDRWGTSRDRFKNITAMWQGFLIAESRQPDLLLALRFAIQNVRRRLYPDDEGVLGALYITGPTAMARAIQTQPDWRRRVKLPCHFGNHGGQLRTLAGSGKVIMTQSNKLHSKLRGGEAHSYPNLYRTRQVYNDDPPCSQFCYLLKHKKLH